MTYTDNDAIDAISEQVRIGQGDRQVKLRQRIYSTIGAHKVPAMLAQEARALGMEASTDTAGGWFQKTHIITVDGKCTDVLLWLRTIKSIEESMQ